MLKVVSGIAAFVLTFGFSVSLVGLLFGFASFATPSFEAGNNHRVTHKITRFLIRDVRNGQFRDMKIRKNLSNCQKGFGFSHNPENHLAEYSGVVSEYVVASNALNDSYLPEDLRYAWRDHMEAWQKHDDLLTYASKGKMEEQKFNSAYSRSSNDIKETWFQVLRIAERYGANTAGMR